MTGIYRGTPGFPLEDALRDNRGLAFPERVWFSPFGQNNSTMTPVAGTYYSAPFIVWEPCTLIGLGIQIGTAPSNDAILKLGVHDNSSRDFAPLNLIYGSNEITGAPLTGSSPQAVTGFSVPLSRGIYWAGFIFVSATTLTNCLQQASIGGAGADVPMRRPWFTYGSSATPTVTNASDTSNVFTQASLTDLPAPFTGSAANNSVNPNRPAAMFFLTSRR